MKYATLFTLLLLTQFTFSQETDESFSIYGRLRACEASLGFEKRINDQLGLAVEAGYRYRFTKEATMGGRFIDYYLVNRAYEGFSVRPIILNFHTSPENTHSISTAYRYLSADKITYDPGKNGGSNTSDYAVYSDQKHVLGISYLYSKEVSWLPILEWYFETGVNYNLFQKHYSIEGSYTNQMPSNRIENGQSFGVHAHFGLKINMVKR
ncbi:MAG: hypothetical protein HWE22_14940 [Flavobacteriales bacterium]|nr:hypothetical protein [Flavobacteriales bacterium]